MATRAQVDALNAVIASAVKADPPTVRVIESVPGRKAKCCPKGTLKVVRRKGT